MVRRSVGTAFTLTRFSTWIEANWISGGWGCTCTGLQQPSLNQPLTPGNYRGSDRWRCVAFSPSISSRKKGDHEFLQIDTKFVAICLYFLQFLHFVKSPKICSRKFRAYWAYLGFLSSYPLNSKNRTMFWSLSPQHSHSPVISENTPDFFSQLFFCSINKFFH